VPLCLCGEEFRFNRLILKAPLSRGGEDAETVARQSDKVENTKIRAMEIPFGGFNDQVQKAQHDAA